MTKTQIDRKQTIGEELANTISHGLGALLSAAGAAALMIGSAVSGSRQAVFSLAVYGLSLVVLYAASAIYHGARRPEVKRRLRVMDHCSIFLLIVGTYAPMSLLVVGGRTGRLLFFTNALLAAVGITLNLIDLERFDRVCLALYALMGWLVVLVMPQVAAALPPLGLALLVAGGVAYTGGILFYKLDRPYMHFIWHLFVLAGSVLQYGCIALCCL